MGGGWRRWRQGGGRFRARQILVGNLITSLVQIANDRRPEKDESGKTRTNRHRRARIDTPARTNRHMGGRIRPPSWDGGAGSRAIRASQCTPQQGIPPASPHSFTSRDERTLGRLCGYATYDRPSLGCREDSTSASAPDGRIDLRCLGVSPRPSRVCRCTSHLSQCGPFNPSFCRPGVPNYASDGATPPIPRVSIRASGNKEAACLANSNHGTHH